MQKIAKNHQKLLQGHNCYDRIMIPMTFPSPLVASIAIDRQEKIMKVDPFQPPKYHWDAQNCKKLPKMFAGSPL